MSVVWRPCPGLKFGVHTLLMMMVRLHLMDKRWGWGSSTQICLRVRLATCYIMLDMSSGHRLTFVGADNQPMKNHCE